MRSIFEALTREQLIKRIQSLDAQSTPLWGTMNIYQMLRHCTLCEEMYLGKTTYKRTLLGRLIGKMALRNLMKDEKPLQRNAPTSPYFKVKQQTGDLLAEKKKWISLIREYEHFTNNDFAHWFFGKMTKDQVGYFVYKHTDHHLRQFNS